MSWIHCNKCFAEPDDSGAKRKFFLTSCSHITCQKCQVSSLDICPTCKKDGVKVLRIDSSMNKHYRQYFADVPGLITTKMEEMGKIRKFQDIQIQNLVKGTLKFQDVVRKTQAALKKYDIEHKRLKKENQDLHFALQKTSSSIPIVARLPSTSNDRGRARSRSANAALISNPKPELRATMSAKSDRQRTRSRPPPPSSSSSSKAVDPLKSSSVFRSNSVPTAPRYDGNNVPKPELRATFSAKNDERQRTRSKSPNTAVYMQGTLTKSSILSRR